MPLRFHWDSVVGEVRIGAFSTAVRGILVEVLPRLRTEHPELRVPMRESEPWETIALVASGQRDLGIVHRWGGVALAMPDHLVETPLFTDVADVILRRDHPLALAGASSLTPLDLAEEEWIATFDSTICRQWLRRLFDGVSNAPRIVHESMEFENHLELVRAGLGVALVPRMGRPVLHEDLVAIPTVRPASTRGVSAVSDVPGYSIVEALRVPSILRDEYGKQPTRPLMVAAALNMSPTGSTFWILWFRHATLAFDASTILRFPEPLVLRLAVPNCEVGCSECAVEST